MLPDAVSRSRGLFPILIGAALAGLLTGCSKSPEQPAAPATVNGADAAEVATEWTVENPTEPAVPVELPTIRMTNSAVTQSAAPK